MRLKPEQSWWSRNWKWFVPVGCLGGIVICLVLVVGILALVFGIMKSSEVYKEAVARAEAHPAVQAAIGAPIEKGMFVTGNINTSGTSGKADLAIPISGPDGKATLFTVAKKSEGQWTFTTLIVEIKDTGLRIDLIE